MIDITKSTKAELLEIIKELREKLNEKSNVENNIEQLQVVKTTRTIITN